MALPFLPGLYIDRSACKTDFRRVQNFSKIDDVILEVDPCLVAPYTYIPSNLSSFVKTLPRWVAFDKQVLSFEAFFQESVTEHCEGSYRIRKVKIYFFLEDDTLMVVEPRVRNTGLNQGVIVKRHRAQRPPPCNHLYYTAEDLNLGNEIEICGRVYKICNCDNFTTSFYKHLGINLKPALCLPPALYEDQILIEKNGRKIRGDKQDLHLSMQFFSRDPYVLRFYCYWDDRMSLHGDVRQLIMHYFLADDTIEIIEILQPNSGRDKIPWLLRRGKVPKQLEPMKRIGEVSKTSVLNVLGESGWSSRFLMDPKEVGKVYDNCYLDCDINIGSELNIFNKRVVVYDMDDFTKEYYKTKYGITDFTPGLCPPCAELKSFPCTKKPAYEEKPCKEPVQIVEGVGRGSCEPEVVECPPHCRKINKLEQEIKRYKERWEHLPPYNGFGSEEDSIVNCLSLHPEHMMMKDVVNFMVHDRRALNSNILRFDARILTNFAPDKERKFILVYYRTNDTFEIHETKINNSGFLAGCFCNRKRIPKPCQEKFKCDLSEYYGPKDLYIDSVIIYSGHSFKLVGADEYALSYMEYYKDEFPQSDVQLVLRKLTPIVENKEMKAKLECCRDIQCMPYENFKCLIKESMAAVTECSCINEHDFITLGRHYNQETKDENEPECDFNLLRVELKRNNFDEFEEIGYTCKHFDSSNSGKLSRKDLFTIMKGHRVPVSMQRFEGVFDQMEDENGMLDYCVIINRMNWKINASIPHYYTTPALERKDKQKCRDILIVDFRCLFDDLIKIIYPECPCP